MLIYILMYVTAVITTYNSILVKNVYVINT